MSSEREIRKLYVNGRTICIEFLFRFFKFSASTGGAIVAEGDDLGGFLGGSISVLAGFLPAKTANIYCLPVFILQNFFVDIGRYYLIPALVPLIQMSVL